MRDTGYRDRHGEPLYTLTMRELESLPGFHRAGGSLRACCPAHSGENPNALRVNDATGAGHCFRCHASFVVEDHPEQIARAAPFKSPIIVVGGQRFEVGCPQTREDAPQRAPRFKTHQPKREPVNVAPEAKERLAAALPRYAAALPGSPGAAYLGGRGIPLDAARALGGGWAASGYFAGRVVFPLAGPDGVPTGATGRAITPDAEPKYKAARTADGYAKTLANGGAIARATADGGPLVVVEGPMDALAIIAGGLMNVVAIGSTSYPWPEHFRGVTHAILFLDNDGAGVKGARAFRDALALEGVAATLLDARALGEHKDAAAYWQGCGSLPPALLDALATSNNFESKKEIRSACPDGDAFAQLQRLARDCPLTAADLTTAERAEARPLAADPDYPASALAADLVRQWDALDVRERTAALYALALATTPGRSFAA